MAQQTINVGTSPNDGTGTPLRTAFQYTNSNFSELYTALGGGTGLPGATTQVIFNDGGTNLAGDAGLVYNKTTDALTIGGNVQAASATITGDLTVDTNVLKVDTTNNRVGIGTASPGALIEAYTNTNGQNRVFINNPSTGSSAYNSIDFTGGTAGNQILSMGSGYSGSFPYTTGALVLRSGQVNGMVLSTGGSAAPIVFGINDSEAMRLNSTGLGVGVAPTVGKVQTNGAFVTTGAVGSLGTTPTSNAFIADFSTTTRLIATGANTTTAGVFKFINASSNASVYQESLTIDASSNVGIGVTPSAWNSNYNALDIGQNGTISGRLGTSNTVDIVSNGFRNSAGNWVYKLATSNTACRYQLDGSTGAHIWYSGAAGTAGNTIAGFSAGAMSLDASGNLLVGKTAIGTTVGVEVRPDGYIIATRSASTDASAFTNAVYSTGASAYRFYVGLGGTVYATNTTISAISDARLKENVQDIDVGLGAILALKPRKFDWKAGKGKDIKGDRGFIAQEFEQVFPQLVDEWADPAPEGEAPYKSVRQDLIPVLVKAIQELAAEVNALKNA